MQHELPAALQTFRAQVESFIAEHWQGPASGAAGIQAWQAALAAAGWSVPQWPEKHGGTGWSPTQLYLWRRACARAGVPMLHDPGVDTIGPLLMRYAGAEQQAAWLPDIRNLQTRWAIAFAEPGCGIDYTRMHTRALKNAGGWQLDGGKCWIMDGLQADWLCCFAGLAEDTGVGLFAVPADASGVTLQVQTSFDGGEYLATAGFSGVELPASALLVCRENAAEVVQFIVGTALSTFSDSAVARAQLAVLDAVLDDLDPADALHAKRHASAVALQALEVMEMRYVDAWERGAPAPFPLAALRLRSRDLLGQLGALQMESFGYYALPYPDATLLHNEGPIGPQGAAAAVRQNLTQHVAAQYEGSAEQLKDAVWRDIARG